MPLVQPGEESAINEPWSRFERHHHARPYAALVIRGSCEEAGDHGRFSANEGDVLVHASFDGHGDSIGRKGAAFINFPLDEPLDGWFGHVEDVDAIVRTNRRNPLEAALLLREQFRPIELGAADWPDLLAAELSGDSPSRLDDWAARHGLHPTTISRGFRQAYGVAPRRFRLERIASRAARQIRTTRDPLAAIAAECGFADQSHMTRVIAALFARPPAALRQG